MRVYETTPDCEGVEVEKIVSCEVTATLPVDPRVGFPNGSLPVRQLSGSIVTMGLTHDRPRWVLHDDT